MPARRGHAADALGAFALLDQQGQARREEEDRVRVGGQEVGRPGSENDLSCALGDAHRLPVKATLRKTIGKEAGDTVHVRIDERIG
jgi:hypothetical protein